MSMTQANGRKIKVLIIDDSALVRNLLTEILSQDPEIDVVGVAQMPSLRARKSRHLSPTC